MIAGGISMMPGMAHAQGADAATRDFNIPAGDLATVLGRYSSQAGLQLVYSSDLVAGLKSAGVSGRMNAQEALARILSGTGLSSTMNGNSVTLLRVDAAGGERVLGAVRVQGAQPDGLAGATIVNGVNGSRDVTATEGTGSYTTGALTVGGKSVSSIKETTQAVSVLTNQQIKDQAIVTMDQALRSMPGVNVTQGPGGATSGVDPSDSDSNLRATYSSRGFAINRVQIDGGAPLQLDGNFQPILDLSLYDHIELVRGSDSFTGFGSPGGVINLVRKRPLDHDQLIVELQAGSWNKYRLMVDATGPLGFGGKLRGRLIATYQSNNYFYDRANDKRLVLGGVVELDVTKSTLLSAGIEYTKQDSLPAYSGVPRYFDGNDIGLPRSTCFCFEWQRYNLESVTPYAQVEQTFGDKWSVKVKVSQPDQSTYEKQARSNGYRNISDYYPIVGIAGNEIRLKSRQTLAEITVNGAFNLFGNEQKVVAGYSMTRADAPNSLDYNTNLQWRNYSGLTLNGSPAYNVLDFDPRSIPDPGGASGELIGVYNERSYDIRNGYLSFDLVPLPFLNKLHILSSIRYSQLKSKIDYTRYCTSDVAAFYGAYPSAAGANCDSPEEVGNTLSDDPQFDVRSRKTYQNDKEISWPPQVKFRYDATRNLSLFGSYNDIFVESVVIANGLATDINGNALAPTRGSNFEAGIKWARSDGKFNANASFYRTETYGGAIYVGSVPGVSCPTPESGRTCYINAPRDALYVQAQGLDLEATGEIFKGLQVSASVNYSKNKSVTDFSKIGIPDSVLSESLAYTRFPKIMYKTFVNYRFSDQSPAKGASLFVGVQGQGSSYSNGNACLTPGPANPVTGATTCIGNNFQNYEWTVPARAIVSFGGSYELNDRYMVQVNIENFFDKTYYASSGNRISNWYGTPRNVIFTLRGKF